MTKDIKKISLPIENINETTPTKPDWKWFFKSILIIWIIIGIGFLFYKILTIVVSNYLDIETEKKIFGEIMIGHHEYILDINHFESIKNHKKWKELTTWLEKIFIENNEMENAFASLGANIMITSGLLEKTKTEEEIIFILGHERAHIVNRDVVNHLASSIPLTLIMEMLWISNDTLSISPENFILSKISRNAEYKADEWGKELLQNLWLNAECAVRFFEENGSYFEKYSEWHSSHPDTNMRLAKLLENNPFPNAECHKFDYQDFKEKFLQKSE